MRLKVLGLTEVWRWTPRS